MSIDKKREEVYESIIKMYKRVFLIILLVNIFSIALHTVSTDNNTSYHTKDWNAEVINVGQG